MPRFLLLLLPWVLIVLVWYGIAWSGFVNPALIPLPHAVAAKFWSLLTTARLPLDIWMSTQRVFIGVALTPLGHAQGLDGGRGAGEVGRQEHHVVDVGGAVRVHRRSGWGHVGRRGRQPVEGAGGQASGRRAAERPAQDPLAPVAPDEAHPHRPDAAGAVVVDGEARRRPGLGRVADQDLVDRHSHGRTLG